MAVEWLSRYALVLLPPHPYTWRHLVFEAFCAAQSGLDVVTQTSSITSRFLAPSLSNFSDFELFVRTPLSAG